jgi:hypothetical protein
MKRVVLINTTDCFVGLFGRKSGKIRTSRESEAMHLLLGHLLLALSVPKQQISPNRGETAYKKIEVG